MGTLLMLLVLVLSCPGGISRTHSPVLGAIQCATWPTQVGYIGYTCTARGGEYLLLNQSLGESDHAICEKMCIKQGEKGCCFFSTPYCYWKPDADVTLQDDYNSTAITCRPNECISDKDCKDGGICHQHICTCKTSGSPDSNKPCVFPFIYGGVKYTTCTEISNFGIHWFSTEVDATGSHIIDKAGNCSPECTKQDSSRTYGGIWIRPLEHDTIVCDRISSAILRCIKPNENVSQFYTLNNEAIEWDEDRSFKGIYDGSNEIKWNNGNTWKKLSYCSSSEECPTDYPHCSSQWRSPDRFGEAFCTSGCEAVQVGNSSCPGKPSSRWRCNGLCLTG